MVDPQTTSLPRAARRARRRWRSALFGAVAVTSLASTASATLILYEPFNYTPGGPVNGQLNANGQTWLVAGVQAPTGITVAPGNLGLPPGFEPAVGNSADINGIGNSSGSALRLGLGGAITTGTVYSSFALRIDELTGSNNTVGGFFTGFNNSTGAQATNPTAVVARLQARIDPSDPTKYQLGIFTNVNATAGATSWGPSLSVGDTHFIVTAYTFNPGAGDDVASLWINPGSLDAAVAPPATVIGTGGTDLGQIASILLRQSPAPHLTLDELRVGTTWADVTPLAPAGAQVPEPGTLGLLALGALGLLPRRRR